MSDFTLTLTGSPSGFVLTARGNGQTTCELPAPSGLTGALAGRRLYQQVFSGPVQHVYQASEPHRVLIYGPEEVLDWPWQQLHDGHWPLAFYHPLILLPAPSQLAPARGVEVEGGPLRILLTRAPDQEHAVLGAAIDRWIDHLEQRSAGRVLLRKVQLRAGYQELLRVFRQTLAPFHLWQHVGPCSADLALNLGREQVQVRDLNILLAQQQAACGLVLASHAPGPSASLLTQLQVPFVFFQCARASLTEDLDVLHGFYIRLLTHDLAVAATLGQLEAYPQGGDEPARGSLRLVARTPHLFAGMPHPLRSPRQLSETQVRENPATLLVLKANPQEVEKRQVRLRIELEVNQIKTVLHEHRLWVDLREEGAVRLSDLSRHLQKHRPALLHFSGHGTAEEELVLEKYSSPQEVQVGMSLASTTSAEYIPYADVARILVEYEASLRCVVFNACSTEALAEAICLRIPCAIGMRGPINDFLAIRFAEIFYRSVAMGESVGLAFRKARSDILSGPHARRAETFQLKCARGVNPDEIVPVAGRGGQV